jgi:foldase protein PrsA
MISLLRTRRLTFVAACCAAVVAVVVAAGCGSSSSSSSGVPKGDVAVCNGQPITEAQLQTLVDQSIESFKVNKQTVPKTGSADYKSLQQRLVQYLVTKCQVEQQAKKLGVKVTPKDIQAELTSFIKQNFGGSMSKYQAALKQQHVTDAQVRQNIEFTVLQNKVVKKVTAGLAVSDDEARGYYDTHATQYAKPQSRHVAHILVKTKALAEKIYNELQNGADFKTLAKKYTIDTSSKPAGGDLGSITKGQTVPPFDKVAFSLPTGTISKPVKSQYGWHVIKALGPVKPRSVIPFDKEKAAIKAQLLQAKQSNAVSKLQAQLTAFYAHRIKYASEFSPTNTQSTPQTTSIIPPITTAVG